MGHGGKREGAGRKPKADEDKLLERLSPLDDMAFDALKDGISKKDYRYVKLFYEYRFGKPRETKDINLDQDVPFIIEMD
jgi:hypothetical protein